MDRIVGSHYKLRRKIGAGSFGEIYSAENTRSHRRVAVKLESVRTRVPQLSYESKLYAIFSGGTGIPRLHWYGTEDAHNIMVVDLLGKSLEDLFVYCHHKLSLKTVLMLVDQMISCVEFIHNKSFIHRDIKPDNFVMGLGSNSTQVFIIDYGLAKKYRDQHTHVHIPYVEGKSLTGTARYASVGALKGVEQSRRDDMESLGFVWLYLLKGSLPWMGLNGRDQKQKYDRIRDVKAKTSFEDLCRGFPNEFVKYFHDVRNLKFTDRPHYAEYRQMFRDLFMREGFVYDYKYDWCHEAPIHTNSNPIPIPSNIVNNSQSRPNVNNTPNNINTTENKLQNTTKQTLEVKTNLRSQSQFVSKKAAPVAPNNANNMAKDDTNAITNKNNITATSNIINNKKDDTSPKPANTRNQLNVEQTEKAKEEENPLNETKPTKETKQSKETKPNKETKDAKETKDPKETKETKSSDIANVNSKPTTTNTNNSNDVPPISNMKKATTGTGLTNTKNSGRNTGQNEISRRITPTPTNNPKPSGRRTSNVHNTTTTQRTQLNSNNTSTFTRRTNNPINKPPQSALAGYNRDRIRDRDQTEKERDREKQLNSGNANRRLSRLAGQTDRDRDRQDSARRYASKPPQSALAGGRRMTSNFAGGGGNVADRNRINSSRRHELPTSPRGTSGMPKRKSNVNSGSGRTGQDNSIRRTLMPHWMEEDKPPAKRATHNNRKSIYHI